MEITAGDVLHNQASGRGRKRAEPPRRSARSLSQRSLSGCSAVGALPVRALSSSSFRRRPSSTVARSRLLPRPSSRGETSPQGSSSNRFLGGHTEDTLAVARCCCCCCCCSRCCCRCSCRRRCYCRRCCCRCCSCHCCSCRCCSCRCCSCRCCSCRCCSCRCCSCCSCRRRCCCCRSRSLTCSEEDARAARAAQNRAGSRTAGVGLSKQVDASCSERFSDQVKRAACLRNKAGKVLAGAAARSANFTSLQRGEEGQPRWCGGRDGPWECDGWGVRATT